MTLPGSRTVHNSKGTASHGNWKKVQEAWMRPRTPAILKPAVLLGEPAEGDSSVSTGTLEKPLHTVVPVVVVLLADAGLQRLEVGVSALHRTAERRHMSGQELRRRNEPAVTRAACPENFCSFVATRQVPVELLSSGCSDHVIS